MHVLGEPDQEREAGRDAVGLGREGADQAAELVNAGQIVPRYPTPVQLVEEVQDADGSLAEAVAVVLDGRDDEVVEVLDADEVVNVRQELGVVFLSLRSGPMPGRGARIGGIGVQITARSWVSSGGRASRRRAKLADFAYKRSGSAGQASFNNACSLLAVGRERALPRVAGHEVRAAGTGSAITSGQLETSGLAQWALL